MAELLVTSNSGVCGSLGQYDTVRGELVYLLAPSMKNKPTAGSGLLQTIPDPPQKRDTTTAARIPYVQREACCSTRVRGPHLTALGFISQAKTAMAKGAGQGLGDAAALALLCHNRSAAR